MFGMDPHGLGQCLPRAPTQGLHVANDVGLAAVGPQCVERVAQGVSDGCDRDQLSEQGPDETRG